MLDWVGRRDVLRYWMIWAVGFSFSQPFRVLSWSTDRFLVATWLPVLRMTGGTGKGRCVGMEGMKGL